MRKAFALVVFALVVFALVVFALVPLPAVASDPTGLFVLFIGFPAVVLSAAVLALAIFWWKIGIPAAVLLLLAHIPVVRWADDVGYMSGDAGWLLQFSGGVTLVALFVSVAKPFIKPATNKAPGYVWSCHACSASNDGAADICKACGCPANASAAEVAKFQ